MILEANISVQILLAFFFALRLSFSINTPRLISFYQFDIMSEVDIPQARLNHKSETASSILFSLSFLSTLLSIYSQVLQPKLDSHTDYNHEFQLKINLFLEIKFLSLIKTKSYFLSAKNKKRISVEIELGKSLTCRNHLRFKYKANQIPQARVKNGRTSRANRGGKVDRADRGGRVDRIDKSEIMNKIVRHGRVGKANRIGRVGRIGREKNRSVTINKTKDKEAEIIKTKVMEVVETTSKRK